MAQEFPRINFRLLKKIPDQRLLTQPGVWSLSGDELLVVGQATVSQSLRKSRAVALALGQARVDAKTRLVEYFFGGKPGGSGVRSIYLAGLEVVSEQYLERRPPVVMVGGVIAKRALKGRCSSQFTAACAGEAGSKTGFLASASTGQLSGKRTPCFHDH